jgi:hypothetical protein
MDELAAKRFDRAETAQDSSANDMLNSVLLDIANGEKFDHVMVLCARRAENGSTFFRNYQAGDFSYVERIGMLESRKMDEWGG